MASAADDFNRANSSSLGANWTQRGAGSWALRSNGARSESGGSYHACYYSATSFNGNQTVRGKWMGNEGAYHGIAVRIQAGADTWYMLVAQQSDVPYFGKVVAGDYIDLGNPGFTLTQGDVWEIKAIGTQVTIQNVTKNSTPVTVNDSSISGGAPGLAAYTGSVGAGAAHVDDWTASDDAAAGPAIMPGILNNPL